jgi:uncharacterized protein with HEPN domain
MISKKDRDYLNNILYSIEMIYKYSDGISKQDFYESQEKQDLIVHRLEIIGEAAKRLSDEVINNYPRVPWREIKGMRDVLIHQYDSILLEIVWETFKNKIPELEIEIKNILD